MNTKKDGPTSMTGIGGLATGLTDTSTTTGSSSAPPNNAPMLGVLRCDSSVSPNSLHLESSTGNILDDLEDSEDDAPRSGEKRAGRRKIKIEYIDDKSRRHITFSKRKAGIMKKAYELSTLTGTQVLLLVASETGHVYTFATPKLQPLITKQEGKNLIQACLNSPDHLADYAAVMGNSNVAASNGMSSNSAYADSSNDPGNTDENDVSGVRSSSSFAAAMAGLTGYAHSMHPHHMSHHQQQSYAHPSVSAPAANSSYIPSSSTSQTPTPSAASGAGSAASFAAAAAAQAFLNPGAANSGNNNTGANAPNAQPYWNNSAAASKNSQAHLYQAILQQQQQQQQQQHHQSQSNQSQQNSSLAYPVMMPVGHSMTHLGHLNHMMHYGTNSAQGPSVSGSMLHSHDYQPDHHENDEDVVNN